MLPLFQRIQRYTLLIIATLVITFAGGSIVFVWQEGLITANQQRNAEFHLRTTLHASSIMEALFHLERVFHGIDEHGLGNFATGGGARLHTPHSQSLIAAIRKEFDAVIVLRDAFDDDSFDPALARIERQIASLEQGTTGDAASRAKAALTDPLKTMRALSLSINQLERLHIITYTEIERRVEADIERRNFIVAPLAIAALSLGILTLFYLVAQLRHALSGYEKANASLRESEGRFKDIVDNLPSSVSLKDLDGRYLLVNRRFREWYVPLNTAVEGQTAESLFSRDLADKITTQDRRVIETGKIFRDEVELPHADGSRHTEIIAKFPVRDPQGQTVAIGVINTDITDHKRLESDLRQVQKMDAVGQLTGGIARDFNNLLAVILGNVELLGDQFGKQNPLLQSVLRAANRGADLTQRLLAFSRKQVLKPSIVDLNACIAGMNDMLRRTLGETIDIETVASLDLRLCEADQGQLENALLNLTVNARDAMPDGGKLTIETANADLDDEWAATQAEVTPGSYVMMAVSDSGTGMSPEVLDRVFEPFFTTKEVDKGTGLGLSMVFGFAKQSGGHVTIYSEEGAGTTVRLYLPKSRAERQAAESLQAEAEPEVEANGEVVLVVEDDADLRTLAVRLLDSLGYRTVVAEDGPSAVAELKKAPHLDLLLTDVVMPGGMNGPALAKVAFKHHAGIKVLYMSGYADSAIARRGGLGKNELLLQKPFRKRDLADMVRQTLTAYQADEAGRVSAGTK